MDSDECEIYIHPGPGTCCPEMRIKDGVCQGCGWIKETEVPIKQGGK